eukprot:m.107043 g.107043  ORF g.107043 m.107043 type:complete len:127 (+) comp37278_c0_seq18:11-391(+)
MDGDNAYCFLAPFNDASLQKGASRSPSNQFDISTFKISSSSEETRIGCGWREEIEESGESSQYRQKQELTKIEEIEKELLKIKADLIHYTVRSHVLNMDIASRLSHKLADMAQKTEEKVKKRSRKV